MEDTQVLVRRAVVCIEGQRSVERRSCRVKLPQFCMRRANKVIRRRVDGIDGDRALGTCDRFVRVAMKECGDGGVLLRRGATVAERAQGGDGFIQANGVTGIGEQRRELFVSGWSLGIQGNRLARGRNRVVA